MRLVLCNGVFDLLHVAHLRHLEQARRMGDALVVGLTRDAFVGKPGRPIIPEEERMELLRGLRCVSAVSLCRDSLEALEHWKPQVFCKGADRQKIGLLPAELDYCAKHGIQIEYMDENPQTTTSIVERIKKCEFA